MSAGARALARLGPRRTTTMKSSQPRTSQFKFLTSMDEPASERRNPRRSVVDEPPRKSPVEVFGTVGDAAPQRVASMQPPTLSHDFVVQVFAFSRVSSL